MFLLIHCFKYLAGDGDHMDAVDEEEDATTMMFQRKQMMKSRHSITTTFINKFLGNPRHFSCFTHAH